MIKLKFKKISFDKKIDRETALLLFDYVSVKANYFSSFFRVSFYSASNFLTHIFSW